MQTTAFAPPATCPLGTGAPKIDREEVANSATHALGALLSIAGLAGLARVAVLEPDWMQAASALVFGASLFVLYSASAVYHGVTNWRWKHRFRCLDYAGIFLLIAGTYTPILVIHLRNTLGWGLLAAVWGLCGLGMVLAIRYRFPWRSQLTSTLFYVALGWLAVLVCRPLAHLLPAENFRLLLLGGACYTAGTVFFAWDRLPYNHAVWHLFVLAGSGCHWLLIYRSLAAD
ncbi:MAG: hemolysin III family protein [Opitutae bacterium]|nr:hemolysin III family protein [Opitutae bacterium]